MKNDPEKQGDITWPPRSLYDPDPVREEDLWFMPGPPEDVAPTDMPWAMADRGRARDSGLDVAVWRLAEAAQYRGLIAAVQAVARFGLRLKSFPAGVIERFALSSVSAVLKGEGVWLSPEQIALYRALRVSTDDTARDLARASWGVRRLLGPTKPSGRGGSAGAGGGDPLDGVRVFLGRSTVQDPQEVPGLDRSVGPEFSALSDHWRATVQGLQDVHPLTRAGVAYALWRASGITPFEERLEPAVAALLIGTDELAPFLPLADGHHLDRAVIGGRAGGAEARLIGFYGAVEAGALNALLMLDRLAAWQARAGQRTADLSGRTPLRLIDTLLRLPVLSAGLVAHDVGCSRPAARRNLALFARRGLVREVTGQARYRFWVVQL